VAKSLCAFSHRNTIPAISGETAVLCVDDAARHVFVSLIIHISGMVVGDLYITALLGESVVVVACHCSLSLARVFDANRFNVISGEVQAKGTIKIQVHYYEDGNVQLNTNTNKAWKAPGGVSCTDCRA
jgi:hypothetical protein